MDRTQTDRLKTLLLAVALLGLIGGVALYFGDMPDLASKVWFAGIVPVLAALMVEILRSRCAAKSDWTSWRRCR